MASFLYHYITKEKFMKALLLILTLFVLDKGCSKSQINQEAITLEYSAMSRGKFLEIKINKKNVLVKKNRNNTEDTSKTCTKNEWERLTKALKNINIENIPHLKAPSNNRFFDGAAIANLTIIYEGNTYKSESFDHGNPPKEIAQLVKEILSISENIE